jgi:biotin operon repressor
MSIVLMNRVWQGNTTEGTERLVLLALADQANDEGFCWPSQSTIATKCNLSRAAVNRHIRNLIEKGEVEISKASPAKYNHKSLTYIVHPLPANPNAPPKKRTPKKFLPPSAPVNISLQESTCKHIFTGTCKDMLTGTCKDMFTESMIEPPLEPFVGENRQQSQQPVLSSWSLMGGEGQKTSNQTSNPGARAALEASLKRQASGAPDLAWVPEPVRLLADAFVRRTGLRPIKRDRSGWLKALAEWQETHLSEQDIIASIDRLKADRMTIASPFSVTSTARAIQAERRLRQEQEPDITMQMLPGETGTEFSRRMQRDFEQSLPVLKQKLGAAQSRR